MKKHNSLSENGWRLVYTYSDPHEVEHVYIKGPIVRYMRMPATGHYSTGKTSYSIIPDASGTRYQKLSSVEHAAKRFL